MSSRYVLKSSPIFGDLARPTEAHGFARFARFAPSASTGWLHPNCCNSGRFMVACSQLPSGKLLHSYWKWPSRNSWFTHWKWWFSRVMRQFTRGYVHVYRRVSQAVWENEGFTGGYLLISSLDASWGGTILLNIGGNCHISDKFLWACYPGFSLVSKLWNPNYI